ncbi:phage portal protein [Limosilactobacillus sp.]|uniref:phage portal protein n=1 Tax=Limosilactobacillus sp. TaxID=2773925 RepID=UPI00345EA74D
MGLFKNLFSSNTPSSTQDPVLDAIVSISSSDPGNSYVGGSVLRNTDVYAAVSKIAGDLASNPIKSDSQLYTKMINDKPNDNMNGYSFKYALATELLLNGNSYARIDLSTHSLKFIPNNQMELQQDTQTGELTYIFHPLEGSNQVIDPSNILHFKYLTIDGLKGVPPLYALRDQINIQKAGNDLMNAFFNNGVHGTVLLTAKQADLSPEARENIRQKFDEATTGDRALNTIVTDDSMDIKSLPLNTDVLKLVNSNDWTTRQIAEAFSIPPEMLGVENAHSNQEQSNLQYLQGGLAHYEEAFINELNYKLNASFAYDNSKLLSLDPQAQQQLAVDGYTNGLYTKNEARAILNLDPVTGGDSFIESEENNGKTIDN